MYGSKKHIQRMHFRVVRQTVWRTNPAVNNVAIDASLFEAWR